MCACVCACACVCVCVRGARASVRAKGGSLRRQGRRRNHNLAGAPASPYATRMQPPPPRCCLRSHVRAGPGRPRSLGRVGGPCGGLGSRLANLCAAEGDHGLRRRGGGREAVEAAARIARRRPRLDRSGPRPAPLRGRGRLAAIQTHAHAHAQTYSRAHTRARAHTHAHLRPRRGGGARSRAPGTRGGGGCEGARRKRAGVHEARRRPGRGGMGRTARCAVMSQQCPLSVISRRCPAQ